MNDEQYMQLALEQAKEAKENGEWPFGAVIVCEGKVVASNCCREGAKKTVVAHAELQSVDDACHALGRNKLSDCVIYCTNEPCIMCAAAIFQAKIPRVVIGASRGDLSHLLRERALGIEDLAKDSGFEIDITRDVLKQEVLELFADIRKN